MRLPVFFVLCFIVAWGVFCLIAAQVDPPHAVNAAIWGLVLLLGAVWVTRLIKQ